MNEPNYAQIVTLVLESLNVSLKILQEVRAQSGMTEADLLAMADKNDQHTRDTIAAYLERLK